MRRITILAVVGLLLIAPVVPAVASSVVTGNPELSYSVADDTFQSNQQATLTVVASNDGNIQDGGVGRFEDQVQTARSVRMHVREGQIDAPIDVKTGTVTAGSIGPGGVSQFSFNPEIGDAEPGTNSFTFDVEYENAEGDVLTASNPIRKTVEIEPERDRFEVTNVSTTATFRISATSDALPKEYASSIEVRYDEADGDTEFTDGISIGVSANEPSGGPPIPPIAIGVVVLLAAIGGVVWYRRR